MRALTIGQVAREAGVGVETVRYYERQGLLAVPARRASGYRQCPKEILSRLQFIRRAKELGFSLREIKELLALRVAPETSCAEVKQQAEAKVRDIDEKISALQEMRAALTALTSSCKGRGPTSDCPILDALTLQHQGEAAACAAKPASRSG